MLNKSLIMRDLLKLIVNNEGKWLIVATMSPTMSPLRDFGR